MCQPAALLVPSAEDALDLGLRYGQVAVLLGCRAQVTEVTPCRFAAEMQKHDATEAERDRSPR